MAGKHNEIKKAAEKVGSEIPQDRVKQHKQISQEVLAKNLLPKNAIGLSDAVVEGVYGQAYRLYNTGRYKDAIQIFRLLIMLNPTEAKYTLGLAACFHMMKEYIKAVNAYALCSVISPESPIPFYHSSDCYIQMKDPLSASVSLRLAIQKAGEKTEFQALKSRAQLMLKSLKKI